MNLDGLARPTSTDEGVEKKHILFVDDEPNFLAGLRRMLRAYRGQWTLYFAESVDEALARCQETSFDTIVSDVNMPGKTGFDLLAALKNDPRTQTIPVIILTGNAEHDLKRRALDEGATDLLNKPVSPEDLLARLRNATRLKTYEDLLRNQNEILEQKVVARTAALADSRQDIIWRLAKAGEYRDEDTGAHVLRVAACCHALSESLGHKSSYSEAIFTTTPLHDIGKIGIPDGILLKPGKLTVDERRIMQRHCEIGAAILLDKPKGTNYLDDEQASDVKLLDDGGGVDLRELAAEIAMTHHEKWDGTGYPNGLVGAEIPVTGQITAIADVYDALRSERAYKPAYDQTKTLAIMREGKGTHFSPEIFDALERVLDKFEEIREHFDGSTEVAEDTDETYSIR